MGLRFLITRESSQSRELLDGLQSLGIEGISIPTLQILPPDSWKEVDAALQKLTQFDWLVFTSANAVEYFFERIEVLKQQALVSRIKIATIGEATVASLEAKGRRADFVPKEALTESLGREMLERELIRSKRFLLPRSQLARPELPVMLRKAGGEVTELIVYRTELAKDSKLPLQELIQSGKLDGVIFTSASTARHFAELLGADMIRNIHKFCPGLRVVSIGPVTSEAIQEIGLFVSIEAQQHTVPGLLREIEKKY